MLIRVKKDKGLIALLATGIAAMVISASGATPPVGGATAGVVRPLVVEGAPFPLTVAEWTPPARDFLITAYGAKADGTPVTEAIEAAIAAAAKAGGGRVVIPSGEWLSGAFRLKGNVALVVEKGAMLHFPDDPVLTMRAPLRPGGYPTLTHRALIEAYNCVNVAIMGEGTIHSDVTYWHDSFMLNPSRIFPRPGLMRFEKCRNVRIEGIKVRGSPAWTHHFLLCTDIVLRGIDSICTGPNTDGLDLESCSRALVEDCSFDQTDDVYTIKSGANEEGRKRNVPTQDVVIRRCRAVNGHALLAIGSEVSGGIRNISMSDCTVGTDVWRFLTVKTNAKRGGFVENIYMENVSGQRAAWSVYEVDMFYWMQYVTDFEKRKAEYVYPTAISNVVLRNVTCGEAGTAVKVIGDSSCPPQGLVVENLRVGKVLDKLVVHKNAPDLRLEGVREDSAVRRDVLDFPPYVRTCDPVKDGSNSVAFDLVDLEELSANAVVQRVLDARIREEVKRGRNVAPRVTPQKPLDRSFSGLYSRTLVRILANLGCALPDAWIADNVRSVALDRKNGVSLKVVPDAKVGELTVALTNGGKKTLKDVWCVVHMAPEWLTQRRTFRVAQIAPSETVTRILPFGAGAHYLPRPVGESPYAAEADFTVGGARWRLWALAKAPDGKRAPNLGREVRHLGPVDDSTVDEATLLTASAEAGRLPSVVAGNWVSPAFSGAAWYDVSPQSRPYTAKESALVRAGHARELVALQFDVSAGAAATVMRVNDERLLGGAVAFLNGERLVLKAARTQRLPVKEGHNRLIVMYPSRAGDKTALLQMSVSQDSGVTSWPCTSFPEK